MIAIEFLPGLIVGQIMIRIPEEDSDLWKLHRQ